MIAAILSDGSVLVRLPSQTVHFDVATRAIHVRAHSSADELGGPILASYPQAAVDRVRLVRGGADGHQVFVELRSGRVLALGEAPSHALAMRAARGIADLTRCRIEVGEGLVQGLPGPSEAFSSRITLEADPIAIRAPAHAPIHDPFEEPTWRIPVRSEEPTWPIPVRSEGTTERVLIPRPGR